MRPICPGFGFEDGLLSSHLVGRRVARIEPPLVLQRLKLSLSIDAILAQALCVEAHYDVPLAAPLRSACSVQNSPVQSSTGSQPFSVHRLSTRRRNPWASETAMTPDNRSAMSSSASQSDSHLQPCDTSLLALGSQIADAAQASTPRTSSWLNASPSLHQRALLSHHLFVPVTHLSDASRKPTSDNALSHVEADVEFHEEAPAVEPPFKVDFNVAYEGASVAEPNLPNLSKHTDPGLSAAFHATHSMDYLSDIGSDSSWPPSYLSTLSSIPTLNSLEVSASKSAEFVWTRPWRQRLHDEPGVWLCPRCQGFLKQDTQPDQTRERIPGWPIRQQKCMYCERQGFCKLFDCRGWLN